MDDNAQTPSVPTADPAVAVPTAPVPAAPVTPAATAQPQPVSRPVEPPSGGGRGVEQGPTPSGPPAREAAPIDEADAVPPAASDDSSDVVDDQVDAKAVGEVTQAEVSVEQMQESHPPVELPPEVAQA